ncbi:molybdopterin-dependent oxidoreductase [Gordonia sp. TBRC 11910]|uniref:Molybdopterin-dependent oxidoreductase n=1 Tax=Gordonia asplenii TaxID=2725283 RepID=A0A848KYL0_9ACTN|nr:molybdopterin-dependent oxidoreductase [Gordonia asplenii]NMO03459.1 molybdopterin-dependent oxidoreductase [Gordonia asplenii]
MTTPAQRSRLWPAALAGVIAVGSGLAIGELVATMVSPDAAPFVAVGSAVVDRTPTLVREWVITTFGTSDKLALFVGMGVVIALLAAECGVAERRRPPAGVMIVVLFGVLGVGAALDRPTAVWTYAIPSAAAAVVALIVLRVLVGMLRGSSVSGEAEGVTRRFVLTAGGIIALAVVAGGVGRRMLADTTRTVADRLAVRLPAPRSASKPIPAGVEVADATSFVTSNSDFYRIDTALRLPSLTTADWELRIHGMVDRELRVRWTDLLSMDLIERYVTLTCVSNEVGGDLIGNARWLGVPMKTLLDRVGVHAGADMLLSTSSDGWTCGTPVSVVADGRDAMLAIGMNGVALPVEHGYPVRQVVPGLYGYVSATKWVVDWELTRFADATAYWTDRGWSAIGPIKLASRIDRPRSSASFAPGDVVVAGTAWSQHVGVREVQVRIDDGPWRTADVATEYSRDTWRQWHYTWAATPGKHTVTCRAIDADGRAQIETPSSPIPNGATGLDMRRFTVE